MSLVEDVRPKPSRNELLDCLTDRRRRQILRLLRGDSASTTERELAELLATDGNTRTLEDVEEVTLEGIQMQLQHVHLPKLADAGLLEWDEGAGTVASTDNPVYDDPEFRRLLAMSDDEWDDVGEAVVDKRLRDVLSVLEASDAAVERDVLARRIASQDGDAESWADAVDSVRTQLHHVHLPKLDGAGLVDYDVDDGTVTFRTGDEEWEQ